MHVRGAPYEPRDLRRRKVEEITITQLQDQILSGSQLSSEVELVQLVQEKIIIIDQTKQNKDNIRKNHFANVYNTVVGFNPAGNVPSLMQWRRTLSWWL
jgi:hypothetical protein